MAYITLLLATVAILAIMTSKTSARPGPYPRAGRIIFPGQALPVNPEDNNSDNINDIHHDTDASQATIREISIISSTDQPISTTTSSTRRPRSSKVKYNLPSAGLKVAQNKYAKSKYSEVQCSWVNGRLKCRRISSQ